jgi:hypothetical protein
MRSFPELGDEPIPVTAVVPPAFAPSKALHSFSPKLSPNAVTPGVGGSSEIAFDARVSTLHASSKGGADILGLQTVAVTPPDL